jgi:AraC-like DNA-binding protein
MNETDQKLQWFHELVACIHDLSFHTYDAEMNLLESSCPDKMLLFDTLLALGECKTYLRHYMEASRMPLVLNNSLGLVWIAVFETVGESIGKIRVMGPTYTSEISKTMIEKSVESTNLAPTLKNEFFGLAERLPSIQSTNYFSYGIMLHYCVTGEKVEVSSLNYQHSSEESPSPSRIIEATQHREQSNSWLSEQTMLKLVREGNLHYKSVLAQSKRLVSIGQMSKGDPLRQAKNSVIIFTSLCARAAIQGGMAPENAYTLANYYIQSVESCPMISDITLISAAMFDDYIKRVHKCKTAQHLSHAVQECCEYIETHLEEEIDAAMLATRSGYAEYYLTKKFKKETGVSMSDYMKREKIEHAKNLLLYTEKNILEISELLHFCSPSYFSETFKQFAGVTPTQYRAGVQA